MNWSRSKLPQKHEPLTLKSIANFSLVYFWTRELIQRLSLDFMFVSVLSLPPVFLVRGLSRAPALCFLGCMSRLIFSKHYEICLKFISVVVQDNTNGRSLPCHVVFIFFVKAIFLYLIYCYLLYSKHNTLALRQRCSGCG